MYANAAPRGRNPALLLRGNVDHRSLAAAIVVGGFPEYSEFAMPDSDGTLPTRRKGR